MAPSRDEVLKALEQVIDPELRRPVTELDMVRDLELHDGVVALTIVLTIAGCPLRDSVETQVEQALSTVPGVTGVELSFDVMTPDERQALTQKLRGGWSADEGTIRIPADCRVIAVASGKGGVGKSTVAANLALALAAGGRRVGLVDADVYGPSVPIMFGTDARPRVSPSKRIEPVERFGIKLMSMGFFLDETSPVIWRGPIVMGIVRQFLRDVDWGTLDVLVVDLPPGTGDAQLTLVQQVPVSGGVIVTTPQDVALLDVARGMAMFAQVNTPVLGVVENMAAYRCPECGTEDPLFGTDGGVRLAHRFGVPLLARIPLVPAVREAGDAGRPIVAVDPDHAVSRLFASLAERVAAAVHAGEPVGAAMPS